MTQSFEAKADPRRESECQAAMLEMKSPKQPGHVERDGRAWPILLVGPAHAGSVAARPESRRRRRRSRLGGSGARVLGAGPKEIPTLIGGTLLRPGTPQPCRAA